MPDAGNDTQESWLAVGSLTRHTPYFEKAAGRGISLFHLDAETGLPRLVSETDGIDNPTYLAISPEERLLFATSEVFGWNEGTVSAFRFDPTTGKLDYINKQPTQGSLTAHLSIDRSGRYLFATNYAHETPGERPGRAMVAFPIDPVCGLGPAIGSVAHHGQGPRVDRQGVPHPHCTLVSPDSGIVSVADLGLDRILHYVFDGKKEHLASEPAFATVLPAGSGPRHFVHAPDGRHFFVLNELSSTLCAFQWPMTTNAQPITTLSTIPPEFHGENLCAGLCVSADGRFLYASNRGHDSIARFAVDRVSGMVTGLGQVPTRGGTPRSFAIAPSGRHLIVGNQNSDTLVVFAIDPDNGSLSEPVHVLETGSPTSIVAFRA